MQRRRNRGGHMYVAPGSRSTSPDVSSSCTSSPLRGAEVRRSTYRDAHLSTRSLTCTQPPTRRDVYTVQVESLLISVCIVCCTT